MAVLWEPLEVLSTAQREQVAQYTTLLAYFNQRINLISRDTSREQTEQHVRHALALINRPFPPESSVVDWGTGGGLPAIPLAIALPDVTIHAVDAVGKKVQAVQAMARRLGLTNLYTWHGRAERWPGLAHYSISRATAPLLDLWRWHTRAAQPRAVLSGAWRPGLLGLKGGDLEAEKAQLIGEFPHVEIEEIALHPRLGAGFEDKYIIAVYNP